jgi:predicted methyltransferase
MKRRPQERWTAAAAFALVLAACAAPGTPALSVDHYAAIVASPDRAAADRITDERRKPVEMLAFIGVRPGATALDLSAARGYTTELIARAVTPGGRVYAQNPPRDPARAPPAQAEGQAAPAAPATPAAPVAPTLVERAARLSQIVPLTRPFEDPLPADIPAGSVDVATLMFNYHDLGHMGVDRTRMNQAVFRSIRAGGIYVIADHAGRTGTGISESGTLHRVEEDFVVREVEAAGFRLAARGGFLRNPNDPRDRNTPVPAMPKDEFVLKFVKP